MEVSGINGYLIAVMANYVAVSTYFNPLQPLLDDPDADEATIEERRSKILKQIEDGMCSFKIAKEDNIGPVLYFDIALDLKISRERLDLIFESKASDRIDELIDTQKLQREVTALGDKLKEVVIRCGYAIELHELYCSYHIVQK